MIDGLYILNTWVMPVDGFAITYQGNDVTKPDTLQSSYSSTIDLPNNATVRRLTEQAQGPDTMSRKIYQKLPAYVLNNGERVFTGVIVLNRYENGWKCNLLEEKANLFDRINRPIKTGEFDRFGFEWNVNTINDINADTGAITAFPVIDYGTAANGELPSDCLFPAFSVHGILSELLRQENYIFAGDWLNDPFYKSLYLPFVEQFPTAHADDWIEARRSRVTLQMADQNRPTIGTIKIDRIQPYTIDNLPEQNWLQGKNRLYNTQTFSYVCDSVCHVQVNAIQAFKCAVATGAFEVRLSLEKNGQEVAFDYWSEGGIYNPTYSATDSVKIDALIKCQPGDQLRIRLFAQRQTRIGGYEFTLYNNSENSWASFVPTAELMFGDVWPVATNLPNLTGLELLKSVAFLMCGTWDVDPLRKQVRFVSLTETFRNRAVSVDLSRRIDESVQGVLEPMVSPYAQKNHLNYKDSDETKKAETTIAGQYGQASVVQFGNGTIYCNAETLDLETTLFELPFSPCVDSTQPLPAYGNPVLIPSRSVSYDTKGISTVNRSGTNARIILVDSTLIPVKTQIIDDSGDIVSTTVNLKGAWFSKRQAPIIRPENAFSLAFPDLSGSVETGIITRYYKGLTQLLKRPRTLTVGLVFRPSDLASLDFGKGVYIGKVRAGNMYLNAGYYYLNKIANYQAGKSTLVTLIGF